MATKLSWTELRRALASRANISEKEANTFLTALNAQLIEALKQDKQVKINGLGTFKLQPVAPRKSVNVTTGEEIIIKGYNKVAFIPEAGVKELVEKNSAVSNQSSTVSHLQEIDPIKKLGEQAEEIVDLLADLGQSPTQSQTEPEKPEDAKETPEKAQKKAAKTAKRPKKPEVPEAPETEPEKPIEVQKEEPKEQETPIVPEIQEEPKVEEPKIEEPKVEEPKVEEPKVEEPAAISYLPSEPEKPKKKTHFWRDTLICVLILLALLAAGYYFLREEVSAWIKENIKLDKRTESVEKDQNQSDEVRKDDKTTDFTDEPSSLTEEATEEGAITEEIPVLEETPIEESAVAITPQRPVYQSYKKEMVKQDSRMAWISFRYYKSKIYWPYIYDANKDRVKNPNIVRVGQELRIPVLTKEQLDTTNLQTLANLDFLRQEAEEKMR